ncbi:hypothetical protein [Paracoccus sp. PAMC 22219]|uniref:hypothetical protein n=1 Tax=Paracoccus sp. PAMC 22219 TaxID=1569209 RepID=UPI0005A6790F|nr:hypothetical protein [Paracoccus sp. PAMC 22219]
MEVWIPLLSAFMGAFSGLLAALIPLRAQSAKFAREIEFQREKLERELAAERQALLAEFGTEQSVETAISHHLGISEFPYRSFPMIRHHLGGFESNELRRLLVRAGAVRFMAADETELWALRDRVADDYRRSRWKHPDAPLNKVTDDHLFPGAFNDPTQF